MDLLRVFLNLAVNGLAPSTGWSTVEARGHDA